MALYCPLLSAKRAGEIKVATCPIPSWGAMCGQHGKVDKKPLQCRGCQSANEIKVAMSPLPFSGCPKRWGNYNGYITYGVLGPIRGQNCDKIIAVLGSQKGGENQGGYIRSALLAAHASTRWLHATYHLGTSKSGDEVKVSL